MRFAALFLISLFPALAQAALAGEASQRLCQAATEEAQLEVALASLAADDAMALARGNSVLFLSCGDRTLLEVMVEARQAENLEYVIIDMGVDVRAPLIPEEGGKLDVTQYLLQQAAVNPSEDVRAFALEYFRNFRDGEFNPNLYLVSMN
jgi:hypothetical protein